MVRLLILCSNFPPCHVHARERKWAGNTTASHSVCDSLVRPLLVDVYWPVQVFVTFFHTWFVCLCLIFTLSRYIVIKKDAVAFLSPISWEMLPIDKGERECW